MAKKYVSRRGTGNTQGPETALKHKTTNIFQMLAILLNIVLESPLFSLYDGTKLILSASVPLFLVTVGRFGPPFTY